MASQQRSRCLNPTPIRICRRLQGKGGSRLRATPRRHVAYRFVLSVASRKSPAHPALSEALALIQVISGFASVRSLLKPPRHRCCSHSTSRPAAAPHDTTTPVASLLPDVPAATLPSPLTHASGIALQVQVRTVRLRTDRPELNPHATRG